jgi:hypothetical protein
MNVDQNTKHTNILKDILSAFSWLSTKLALQPDEVEQFNGALGAIGAAVTDLATASNPVTAVEGAVMDGTIVASDVATLAATVQADTTTPAPVAVTVTAPVQQADPTSTQPASPAPVATVTASTPVLAVVETPAPDETNQSLWKFDPLTGLPITH